MDPPKRPATRPQLPARRQTEDDLEKSTASVGIKDTGSASLEVADAGETAIPAIQSAHESEPKMGKNVTEDGGVKGQESQNTDTDAENAKDGAANVAASAEPLTQPSNSTATAANTVKSDGSESKTEPAPQQSTNKLLNSTNPTNSAGDAAAAEDVDCEPPAFEGPDKDIPIKYGWSDDAEDEEFQAELAMEGQARPPPVGVPQRPSKRPEPSVRKSVDPEVDSTLPEHAKELTQIPQDMLVASIDVPMTEDDCEAPQYKASDDCEENRQNEATDKESKKGLNAGEDLESSGRSPKGQDQDLVESGLEPAQKPKPQPKQEAEAEAEAEVEAPTEVSPGKVSGPGEPQNVPTELEAADKLRPHDAKTPELAAAKLADTEAETKKAVEKETAQSQAQAEPAVIETKSESSPDTSNTESNAPESKPVVPQRPANRPRMARAAIFENAAAEHNEPPKPRPKPNVASKIGALRSSIFADLNNALARGPPGVARRPSEPQDDATGESDPAVAAAAASTPSSQAAHKTEETADTQLASMPANPRARARGPKRRLPAEAVASRQIVTAELWALEPASEEKLKSPRSSVLSYEGGLSKNSSAADLTNYLLASQDSRKNSLEGSFAKMELPALASLVDKPLSPEITSVAGTEPPSRASPAPTSGSGSGAGSGPLSGPGAVLREKISGIGGMSAGDTKLSELVAKKLAAESQTAGDGELATEVLSPKSTPTEPTPRSDATASDLEKLPPAQSLPQSSSNSTEGSDTSRQMSVASVLHTEDVEAQLPTEVSEKVALQHRKPPGGELREANVATGSSSESATGSIDSTSTITPDSVPPRRPASRPARVRHSESENAPDA